MGIYKEYYPRNITMYNLLINSLYGFAEKNINSCKFNV